MQPSLCIRSIIVTQEVDFDYFKLCQKQSKSTHQVTMQLGIDKEGGILYISSSLSHMSLSQ